MKKIILATAISALFSASAFAATTQYVAKGDIDFYGYVTNEPCDVTIDNGTGTPGSSTGDKIVNFAVHLDPITMENYNAAASGIITANHKDFVLTATGANCHNAKLKVKPADANSVYSADGVLIAKKENPTAGDTSKIHLHLAHKASTGAVAPVIFVASDWTALEATDTTPPTGTVTAGSSKHDFQLSYYKVAGNALTTGTYKTTINYVVEND